MKKGRIQLHCSFLLLTGTGTLLNVAHKVGTEPVSYLVVQRQPWDGPASFVEATRGSFSSTMNPSSISKI